MAISKLEKEQWHAYFDNLSKILAGKSAEIEVDSLELGQQMEAEWAPLLGIVYDHKNDVVEILIDGLDHLIHHPREIYVDQQAGELSSLEVIDDDGMQQIVKLRNPLMLPAPGSQ
jgi:hypothetical protein